jgi:exosortase N
MGLNLFKTGILFVAIIIALEEKKQQKTFDFLQLIIVFLAVIVLNIFSNYFRIITLVLFECIEDNFLHQLIGWVSFLIYQIIPTLFLIKYGIKPKLKPENYVSKTNKSLFFILSIIVMFTSIKIKEEKNYYLLQNLPQKYKNGTWVVKNHVYKKVNQDTLVYVKAPFHKPTNCWTGSGYKILNQKITQKNKDKIWKITMEKNHKKYHSYYWYQVGNCKETSYIRAIFLGFIDKKPIQLINETVALK